MRQILSSIITTLLGFAIASAFFSYKLSAILFVCLAFISFVCIFIFRKSRKSNQNKSLVTLVIFSLASIAILAYLNNLVINQNKIAYQNSILEQDKNKKLEQENLVKESRNQIEQMSLDEMMKSLQIKIQNQDTKDVIADYLKGMERVIAGRVSKDVAESYSDMGKVYEAAYVLNITTDKSLALLNYKEYINLNPKDVEGYATVARFLALDKNSKKEALKYAKKALELSRTKNDKDKYNTLVQYVSGL